MNIRKQEKFPLVWIPIVFFIVITFLVLYSSLDETPQIFGYPLDDTYIHMAIAKNFVQFGNWGVTKGQFTSTTSSPLWTFLVALAYQITGVNDWVPLGLNFLFGVLGVGFFYQILNRYLQATLAIIITIAAVILTPLPVFTLLGMEHNLHFLVTIGFAFLAANYLGSEESRERKFWPVLILAFILTMVRYEGFFMVAVVMALLVFKRKIPEAAALFGVSILFHVVYGIISMEHGWYFLPNTILIKGNLPELSLTGILKHLGYTLLLIVTTPHIVVLLAGGSFLLFWTHKNEKRLDTKKALLVITVITTILHLLFADVGWNYRDVGWLYRYESYLIFLLLFAAGIAASSAVGGHNRNFGEKKRLRNGLILTAIITVMALPLIQRAYLAYAEYPNAKKNIFEQHYQMGLFVQTYYEGKKVALNDIGMVSYLGEAEILDVMGLGSMEFGRLWIEQQFTQDAFIEILNTRDVDLVMVYDHQLGNAVPENWAKVGEWQISENVVSGSDTVAFYAVSSVKQHELLLNLQDFSDTLPPGVLQSGVYRAP